MSRLRPSSFIKLFTITSFSSTFISASLCEEIEQQRIVDLANLINPLADGGATELANIVDIERGY